MIRIDMHVHSTHSDGTCTVGEIVRQAAGRGIALLALTDHDTLEGLDDLHEACGRHSVRPLSGVELSAKHRFTVHILGYRLTAPAPLRRALHWVVERRNERNRMIAQRLDELGLDIRLDEVEAEAKGNVVARPHFASVLLRKGYVANHREAFTKYLAKGGGAYFPRESFAPADYIALIRESGGLSSLAHPSQTGLDEDGLDAYLGKLKDAGLWGLECIYSGCSPEQSSTYFKLASRHGLFPTAGSDFHGSRKPGISLGVQVREDFLPWARLGIKF